MIFDLDIADASIDIHVLYTGATLLKKTRFEYFLGHQAKLTRESYYKN